MSTTTTMVRPGDDFAPFPSTVTMAFRFHEADVAMVEMALEFQVADYHANDCDNLAEKAADTLALVRDAEAVNSEPCDMNYRRDARRVVVAPRKTFTRIRAALTNWALKRGNCIGVAEGESHMGRAAWRLSDDIQQVEDRVNTVWSDGDT